MGLLDKIRGLFQTPDPEPLRSLTCASCQHHFQIGEDAGMITDDQVAIALKEFGTTGTAFDGPARPEFVQHVELDDELRDQAEDALLILAGTLSRGEKRLWVCGECRTVNAYPGHEQHLADGPPAEKTYTLVARDITDPEKQFEMGQRYLVGAGVPKDAVIANDWFSKAADQGHARAQFCLAVNYHGGVGTFVNKSTAFKWYLKAAEQGIARAQCTVAILINDGQVAPRDIKKVIYWLEKASAQGDGSASYNLAIMYYNGDGVSQSNQEAIRLFKKSAKAGYVKAAEVLSQIG